MVAQNPFYNPTSLYGLQNTGFWQDPFRYRTTQDYSRTDAGQYQAMNDQQAYFLRQLGDYNPFSMKGNFAEQQTQRAMMGYRQALFTNPELKPHQYFPGIAAGINSMFNTLGPEQQGYSYSRYAPAAQRIPRGF